MLGYHRDEPTQYMHACDETSVWIEVENERVLKTGYLESRLIVMCLKSEWKNYRVGVQLVG